jgi:methyl-accepting chemotaxis protein WspA
LKDLSVRGRIIGCFLLVLAVVTVMGAVSFNRLVVIGNDSATIKTSAVPGLSLSLQLMNAWEEEYSLLQAHILENDQTAIAAAGVRVLENHTAIASLLVQCQAVMTQDQERQALLTIEALGARYMAAEALIIELSTGNKDDQARDAMKSQLRPIFQRIQSSLQAVVDFNKGNANVATGQIVSAVGDAKIAIIISFLVAAVLAMLSGFYLFRAITAPLSKLLSATEVMRQGDFSVRLAVDRRDEFGALSTGFNRMADDLTTLIGQVQKIGVQVSTSITEIAATSKQQQATATEIAATTTEIGATAREISATSSELVRTMGDVSTVAEQTASLAGDGQAGISRMEETMGQVVAAAASINAKLGTLSEKAGNINQVVTTITKVADQTNLLSLNAAIEAEKAGEYGRGFAVVATEIRRLADQTAVSTYDIEQMVKDIQSAVAAGVMGMDKFAEEVRRGMIEMQQVGSQLSQIIQQVQGLAPRVENVSEGMQAQATGAEQISLALSQLLEAAQQTVDSLRQSSLAMDELNHASGGLHSSVVRFKLRA